MKEVYIIVANRTPIGSFGGVLSSLSATQLGSSAIQGALSKANIDAKEIDEIFMGNVLSANLGQAPARQAAIGGGIGYDTPCTTINKVCASGMKAVMLGAQSIMLGINDAVISGGMESMSNAPYYLSKARSGYRYGNGEIIDGLAKDGLLEPYHNFPMGNCADHTAKEMQISREEQDEYAINSYTRSARSWANNCFDDEVTPIELVKAKGGLNLITEDEEYKKVDFEKIPKLRPIFSKEGTVTAANASTINDGAAALVLVSKEKMIALGVKPIAKILGFADAAQAPIWFTTSPSLALPKAIKHAGLTKKDIDYYEINEAFSVVALANNKKMALDTNRVNSFGGSVSLGHPLGASGARIITTLLSVLKQKNGHYGAASICNGGGGASAIIIEKI